MLNRMRETIPKLRSDNMKNLRKNLTIVSEVLKNNLFLVKKKKKALLCSFGHRQHTLVVLSTQTP